MYKQMLVSVGCWEKTESEAEISVSNRRVMNTILIGALCPLSQPCLFGFLLVPGTEKETERTGVQRHERHALCSTFSRETDWGIDFGQLQKDNILTF